MELIFFLVTFLYGFQELNLPHHACTSSAFTHWVIFLGQKQTFIKKKYSYEKEILDSSF